MVGLASLILEKMQYVGNVGACMIMIELQMPRFRMSEATVLDEE